MQVGVSCDLLFKRGVLRNECNCEHRAIGPVLTTRFRV